MSSNTSTESPTTPTAALSTPLSSTQASLGNTVSQLENTMRNLIVSPTLQTGGSVSNLVLMPSEPASPLKPETPATTSSLKSNVAPHELLESLPPEPRILRVSQADIEALCQAVQEFKEQCTF